MYVQNLYRSIILLILTFTLLLGIFTNNVMAANEPTLSSSDVQQLNAKSDKSEIAKLISKALPSLQLGDGASNEVKDAVFLLQELLVRLDRIDRNFVNGEFSDKTEEAVKNYQKDKSITQDGVVGKNTWSKLGDDIVFVGCDPEGGGR